MHTLSPLLIDGGCHGDVRTNIRFCATYAEIDGRVLQICFYLVFNLIYTFIRSNQPRIELKNGLQYVPLSHNVFVFHAA